MSTDPEEPATETGPQEGRCGAIRERDATGTPIRWCRNWPMKGQARCRLDGGAAPQAKAAAQRRGMEATAAALAVTYGLPVEVDPVDALLGELWRTQGIVLWLQAQIAALTPEDVVWGKTEVVDKGAGEFTGTDTTESAAAHVLVDLYQRERAHLAKVAKDCATVGIELKQEQRMAAIASDVMARQRALLAAFGLDPDAPEVLRVVIDVMRRPVLEVSA